MTTTRLAYTCPQAAALLGVKPKTVRGWIAGGRLRASKPSERTYLITAADLSAFLRDTAVDTRPIPVPRGRGGPIPTPRVV